MVDPEVLERIAARRAELDRLEEQLQPAEQLFEVGAERDELPRGRAGRPEEENPWGDGAFLSSIPRHQRQFCR
ncbi:hypothetical protein AB0C59_33890 [Streptomyces sp. NPDC048664]|uniref:hypothetical protein n=1 Tax=Streptomyces sp. NPDC048664 TaxID=3154505 RepID=UPI00344AB187